MDRFVCEQNITNFADKLVSELDPSQRATLRKLLVEEEDRAGHRAERLDLANRRIASSRELIAGQQRLITLFEVNGRDTTVAELLLTQMKEVLALFESYRDELLRAAG